jgi:integrase/recombinase XerD
MRHWQHPHDLLHEEGVALGFLDDLPFWSGVGLPKSAVADWQRTLARLFKLVGLAGHAHRFRDSFAVNLLQRGVSLENVAILLGNSIKVAEKHYAPWVASRQAALTESVRRAWVSSSSQ